MYFLFIDMIAQLVKKSIYSSIIIEMDYYKYMIVFNKKILIKLNSNK